MNILYMLVVSICTWITKKFDHFLFMISVIFHHVSNILQINIVPALSPLQRPCLGWREGQGPEGENMTRMGDDGKGEREERSLCHFPAMTIEHISDHRTARKMAARVLSSLSPFPLLPARFIFSPSGPHPSRRPKQGLCGGERFLLGSHYTFTACF